MQAKSQFIHYLLIASFTIWHFLYVESSAQKTESVDSVSETMADASSFDGLNEWLNQNILADKSAVFSFVYDGRPSGELLQSWERKQTTISLDETRTKHVVSYLDPDTELEVRCEAIIFKKHSAIECVVYLRNRSFVETPIVSQLQAIDAVILNTKEDSTLHYARGVGEGVVAAADDFRPVSQAIDAGTSMKFAPKFGRPSWGASLPFFNVATRENNVNRGVIAGIGWTGQWQAVFTRDEKSISLRSGMEHTHLKLYPGEEIRTPKVVLLFWQGHRQYGQNLFRRLVLDHYHPQHDEKPLRMPFLISSAGLYNESYAATEENQIDYATKFESLRPEFLWLDVGWHDVDAGHTHLGPADRKRFPRDLRGLSDALRSKNIGLLAWMAPEFQGGSSWMNKTHPELFLGLKDEPTNPPSPLYKILNYADKDAVAMVTDNACTMVERQGIGIYRMDGPIGANHPDPQKQPLQWWRDADAPDRQGITEIRYIEGLYHFWDEIRRRNPNVIIDLCGGGATRIDLEAMSRCVYLWRSDDNHPGFEPNTYQSHTFGISQWIPSTGTASGYPDTYSFRSSMNNGVAVAWNPYQPDVKQSWPLAFPVKQAPPHELKKVSRGTVDGKQRVSYEVTEPFPWEKARRLVDEFQRIRGFFYADFYPLTPYSIELDTWMAFQFHDEPSGRGIVLAFRRSENNEAAKQLRLWGLRPDVQYAVHFEDNGDRTTMSGKELKAGLSVTISDQPGSALITYQVEK